MFVLVDAIAKCMCLEDRECCKVGEMALGLILDTASVLVGDKEKVRGVCVFVCVCMCLCTVCMYIVCCMSVCLATLHHSSSSVHSLIPTTVGSGPAHFLCDL